MASPGPTPLDLVHKAIAVGTYGNIQWKESAARLVRDDADMQGLAPGGIRVLLRNFVINSGRLTQRLERRTEYRMEHPYWFAAVIPVPQFSKGLFVELILIDADENDPFVEIVSAHRQH